MFTRVIVGGCVDGQRLGHTFLDEPGTLTLVVEEAEKAVDLREEGLPVERGDPHSPSTWEELEDAPDIVILACGAVEDPVGVVDACRTAYPDAYLIAIGENIPRETAEVVDRAVDLEVLSASELTEALTDPVFAKTLQLLRTLDRLDDIVAVVTHDNPDPDAIASAVGVVAIAQAVGTKAKVYHGGEVSHQENRAFVNALDIELHQLGPETDIDAFGGIVLVDHAHPGVNDRLPPETEVDVIIDHHPTHEIADASIVDQRYEVGSTSTLVADHLLRAGIEIDSRLATALWYGLKIDSNNFRRGISPIDFTIAARLREHVDDSVLRRIESPRMTADTLETIATAITNREVGNGVLVTDVGELRDRDALAQAADDLLMMEDIQTVCVFGRGDDTFYVSARTSDDSLDLGDAIRFAFGSIGNAGGHEDMAGAQLPISAVLEGMEEDEVETPGESITKWFFDAIKAARRPLTSGYLDEVHND